MKKYHYTYWLSASPTENYIGCRSCKCKPQDDTEYMSSSHVVKDMIAEGRKFHKHILKVWPTRQEAMEHEILMHRVLDVGRNPLFLNKVRQKSTGFDTTGLSRKSPFKGRHHTPESKAKLSAAHIGRKLSDEHKASISAANKGKKVKPEVLAARIGRKLSDEHKAKISAKLKGKKFSAETKAKMSAAWKHRKVSDETKAKLSVAGKGRKLSAEQCAKISAVHKGKVVTEETREKLRAAWQWRLKKKALTEQIEKIDKILKLGELYYV